MILKKEEQRRFSRLDFKNPLRYKIRGENKFENALCENLSLGGLGFENEEFVPPSTPVTVEINIPYRTLKPLGRVVWSAPLPHSDKYRLGIEFLNLDPKDWAYLENYLQKENAL